MRLKLFIVLTILAASFNVNAQTYSRIVSDKEIIGFIDALKKDKLPYLHKISRDIFLWDGFLTDPMAINPKGGFRNIDSCKKYLSTEDFDYMELQARSEVDSIWKKDHLKKYQLIGEKGIEEIYTKSRSGKRTIKDNFFHVFSIPLFNQKKDMVVININYGCGFMCGTMCNYLFKLEQGKWRQVKEWNCWSE